MADELIGRFDPPTAHRVAALARELVVQPIVMPLEKANEHIDLFSGLGMRRLHPCTPQMTPWTSPSNNRARAGAPWLLPLRMCSIRQDLDLREVAATMVVVQTLHRRWEQSLRLLRVLRCSIGNDTQADLGLGNQPGRLDLLKRFCGLCIRLDLMPAQHLDGPVGGEQVEPEPLGCPPLPHLSGPLHPSILTRRPPTFRRLRARRHCGAINGQHDQPVGTRLGHLVGGMGTQEQFGQPLEQRTRRLLGEFLVQPDSGLLHVGWLAALRHLQRLVQGRGAAPAALTVKVGAPESDRADQQFNGVMLRTAGRLHLPTLGQAAVRCSTKPSVTFWVSSFRKAKTVWVSCSRVSVGSFPRASSLFSH
jgi:hypothetical protein